MTSVLPGTSPHMLPHHMLKACSGAGRDWDSGGGMDEAGGAKGPQASPDDAPTVCELSESFTFRLKKLFETPRDRKSPPASPMLLVDEDHLYLDLQRGGHRPIIYETAELVNDEQLPQATRMQRLKHQEEVFQSGLKRRAEPSRSLASEEPMMWDSYVYRGVPKRQRVEGKPYKDITEGFDAAMEAVCVPEKTGRLISRLNDRLNDERQKKGVSLDDTNAITVRFRPLLVVADPPPT